MVWLTLAIGVALASASISIVAYRLTRVESSPVVSSPSPTDPAQSSFTLEATPAGTDASGAMLLRVQLVRRPR